jgi:hypothetical protein
MQSVKTTFLTALLALAAILELAAPVRAAIEVGPIPDARTVVFNNLRWAYASSVAVDQLGSNTLLQPSDNNNVGWRFATLDELALRPPVSMFEALPNGAAAAAPYWNTLFAFVDVNSYAAGMVTSVRYNELGASNGATEFWETVYVKDLDAAAVPEPLSLLMWGGLAAAALARRRCALQAR